MNIRQGYSYDDVLLVPQQGVLNSRKDADISTELFEDWPLLIPIISANMPSVTDGIMAKEMYINGGKGVIPRFSLATDQIQMYKDSRQTATVSIGLKDGFSMTKIFWELGAGSYCLDIAHGDTKIAEEFVRDWKSEFGYCLMVGNVATYDGASRLIEAGADAIKVGIGPGAACTTREVTGFGVPQLTAIEECARTKEIYPHIRIIADGGIKNSGDIVKALAAGADVVMLGRLLAGCDEAPHPGEYFGNASHRMNGHNAPEGIAGKVENSGPVSELLKKLCWGIRSGISYAGASNIKELQENAEWVSVSEAARYESGVRI